MADTEIEPKQTRRGRSTKKDVKEKTDVVNAAGDAEPDPKPTAKKARGKKRESTDKDADNGLDTPPTKLKKRESIPDISGMDFSCNRQSEEGKSWNFKISSWNVNGLRAWIEKEGHTYLTHEKPDVLCLQETKCSEDKLPSECKIEGYHSFWSAAEQDGYSGTGMYCKDKPLSVKYGIGHSEHDNEGRTITAEFDKFFLVTAYVPNSGRGLPRLPYRTKQWDVDFRAYLKKLDETKPVILCGDLNVAHKEIDLANPKGNKKTAGFTPEEREEFGKLLDEGFVDSFRHIYPDITGAYSYWTFMGNARAKNVGWRLDYFVVSQRFMSSVCDSVIRKDVMGSDHCPIALNLAL